VVLWVLREQQGTQEHKVQQVQGVQVVLWVLKELWDL
jgi:hypothetical protein